MGVRWWALAVGGSSCVVARAYVRGVDDDRRDGGEWVVGADGEHDDAVDSLRVCGVRRFDRRAWHEHHLVVFLDAFVVERVVESHVTVWCAAAGGVGEDGQREAWRAEWEDCR